MEEKWKEGKRSAIPIEKAEVEWYLQRVKSLPYRLLNFIRTELSLLSSASSDQLSKYFLLLENQTLVKATICLDRNLEFEIRANYTITKLIKLRSTVLSRASVNPRASAHSPILTVLWLFEVLFVTAHHAKFLHSETQVHVGPLSSHNADREIFASSLGGKN